MQKILILLILISSISFSQNKPNNFYLGDENKLQKVNESDNPASNSISDIVVLGDTVWIGTSRGVSLTTNSGESWTNFYKTPSFGTESISAIAYDKYTGTFWAATAHSIERDGSSLPEGSGLRYTSDNGITWNTISQPLDNENDTTEVYGINTLRALPVTVKVQNIIYDIAFTPGTIWIATFAGGLRKSTDIGQTWQRVVLPPDFLNEVNPDDTLDFCLSPVAGNFCSGNNLNHRLFSVLAVNDSTLYAGSAGGVNKSTDNGISWKKFSHQNQLDPISGNFIVALGYNETNNQVWAASWRAEGSDEFYGVSATTNGGDSWITSLEGERAHNFGFDFTNVIAATDNGPFKSGNLGTSWILPGNIIDNQTNLRLSSNEFFSSASENNVIWLGSGDGLAKLNEAGNWTGEWKLFFASQKLESRTETYAYPNPFNPGQERLKIKYSTAGKQTNVTIRIFDFNMTYVSTIVQNVQRGNPTHSIDDEGVIDFWDGRDASGNVVPNGVYFYRVEVGDQDPVYGKILVLQ